MKCSLPVKNTQNFGACSQLQAKRLVIAQEKDKGIKMAQSYLLQQNVGVELHMIEMLKQFLLQLDGAGTASLFNVLNFDIIDGGPC